MTVKSKAWNHPELRIVLSVDSPLGPVKPNICKSSRPSETAVIRTLDGIVSTFYTL